MARPMGYDIYAMGPGGEEVAYFQARMGTFRCLRQQGYDWFDLIDAKECDGLVSGKGITKYITSGHLKHALEVLQSHDPGGRLARMPLDVLTLLGFIDREDEFVDTFSYYKDSLAEFMEECIYWCEATKNQGIDISFA